MHGLLKELKAHSLQDIFGMGISFIHTKLFFPRATLIRFPFRLRGKKAAFQYAHGFTTGRNCRVEIYEPGVIRLGKNCRIGDNVHLAALESVSIGHECLFASKVFISDISHGNYSGDNQSSPAVPPNDRPLIANPVSIGNNVWLGENVVVLGGVTIGDGAIIGANSTVTTNIPDNCIAVGSPARPIKQYDISKKAWINLGSK